jgi:D-xylose transport system substrate-binding protein
MTVYKATRPEAETAAKIAVALAQDKPIPTSGLLAPQTKTNNGSTDVPSYLLTPVAVTKDNMKSAEFGGQPLIGPDGYWTAEQVCTAQYQAACQQAGIS